MKERVERARSALLGGAPLADGDDAEVGRRSRGGFS
jgi:hypothetical protein